MEGVEGSIAEWRLPLLVQWARDPGDSLGEEDDI